MSANIYEITYYSSAKAGLEKADITAILDTAKDFNAKNEITGCLVHYKHQFIQVLEGEKAVVEKLLSRIKNDRRHSHLYVISQAEKEERTFSNWTMAYRQLSDQEANAVNDELFKTNFLTFSAFAAKPTQTIKSFWSRVQRLLTDDFTT